MHAPLRERQTKGATLSICFIVVVAVGCLDVCFGGDLSATATATDNSVRSVKSTESAKFRFDCDKNLEVHPPEGAKLKVGSSSLMLNPASGDLETGGKVTVGGVDIGAMVAELKADVVTLQTANIALTEENAALKQGAGATPIFHGEIYQGVVTGGVFFPTNGEFHYSGGWAPELHALFKGSVTIIQGSMNVQDCEGVVDGGGGVCDDLSLFDNVVVISGDFEIANNKEGLTTLDGAFPALRNTGGTLHLSSNTFLVSANNLFLHLTHVGGASLVWYGNDVLASLVGSFPLYQGSSSTGFYFLYQRTLTAIGAGSFAELRAIKSFEFNANYELETLGPDAFGKLESMHEVQIKHNYKLVTVGTTAFANVATIGAQLSFYQNGIIEEPIAGREPYDIAHDTPGAATFCDSVKDTLCAATTNDNFDYKEGVAGSAGGVAGADDCSKCVSGKCCMQ